MTSLNLISKSKINQKATLILLNKIEELRALPIQDLRSGESEESNGGFQLRCSILDHTPYFGTKQIRCCVLHLEQTIVESIFYRSE